MDTLTEADVVRAYARAWNRLRPREFVDLLATDVRYTSMWVFEELQGCKAVAEYLTSKMHAVRQHSAVDSTSLVRAELGKTTISWPGRDCVVLTQNGHVAAAALFEVANGLIKKIDLCMPELLRIVRSGEYPQ